MIHARLRALPRARLGPSPRVSSRAADRAKGWSIVLAWPRQRVSEGVLFICDEVQSGYGRTGRMFAIEHYGVTPDIICQAKGIANGWPLGAFTTTAEIADAFQVGDHLSTFGGNPVRAPRPSPTSASTRSRTSPGGCG